MRSIGGVILAGLVAGGCSPPADAKGKAAETAAKAVEPEEGLVQVSDTVEKPGGGDPIGFSVRAPKGALPAPKLMPHMRAFGQDVKGGRVSIALTRYADDWSDINQIIQYKASIYGGLDTRQELEKGRTYLAVLKPVGDLQSVFVFKKARTGYAEMECTGPPIHAAMLKEACASLEWK